MRWFTANSQQVLNFPVDHLALSVPTIVIIDLIAVPVGRLAWRHLRWGWPLSVTAPLLYAIPVLPLLIVILAIFGAPLRSPVTMIAALSIYGIALLIGTATDAFASVDRPVREAAIEIGLSLRSVFWRVDLPLATPFLLSGLQVVSASTIGLVTIGTLIEVPSLGSWIPTRDRGRGNRRNHHKRCTGTHL